MGNLGEAFTRGAAHLFARAVGALQLREAGLDGRVPGLEGVIGGVADLGGVVGVVGPVRAGQRI